MYFQKSALTREQLDQSNDLILLAFGIDACPHCQRGIQAFQAVTTRGDIKHLAIEDGAGRRLGRSFKVKLWPTFILYKNGAEYARVVRPQAETDFASFNQYLDQA